MITGDATGLPLPATPEELAQAGADWLTQAFRAFGSLDQGNAVAKVVSCQTANGGNSGAKALLELTYAQPDPALDTRLFVKFSRDFADPFRDRRKHELEAEVRLAVLSRHPAFPVKVAKAWFADFDHESGTGLLITSCVPFGSGRIEPQRRKCRDHELSDPLPWYRATMTALAQLAAADKAGQLSPELERLFPYDRDVAAADMPFACDATEVSARVARYAALAQSAPQLFPEAIRTPDFLQRMERDALALLRHETALRHFLHADERLIALTHWNTNLDNAWFEREPDGRLTAGLLDWGMVRRMNGAYGIWGGLSAAEPAMLLDQLDGLLELYAQELAAHGGPAIDPDELGLHFDLSLALLGMALMLDAPALFAARMPNIAQANGPHNPMIAADGVVEGFLKVFTNFLLLWEQRDFGRSLARMLERV